MLLALTTILFASAFHASSRAAQDGERAPVESTLGTIRGVVLTSDGSRLRESDAVVDILRSESLARCGHIEPSGEFEFTGLPTGRYAVACDESELGRAIEAVELRPGALESRIELRLERRFSLEILLADRVRSSPQGGDLEAFAVVRDPGDWLAEDSTCLVGARAGRFQRANAADPRTPRDLLGRISCDLPPPFFVGLAVGPRVIALRRVESAESSVTFELESPLASMRDGEVRWRAPTAPEPDTDECPDRSRLHRLDHVAIGGAVARSPDGEQVHSGLAPGWYRLEFTRFLVPLEPAEKFPMRWECRPIENGVACGIRRWYGDESRSILFRLERGERRDFGELAKWPVRELSGRLHLASALGERIRVRCRPIGLPVGSPGESLSGSIVVPEPTGRFRFPCLSPGAYLLRVEFEAFASCETRVDLRERSIDDLALSVAPPVSACLHPPPGEWRSARFELRTPDDLVAAAFDGFDRPLPRRLKLAPGRYELLTWRAPWTTAAAREVVVDRDGVEIEWNESAR